MPITPTEKIWMNGELLPWEDAKIHVLTHTLHYGMGVFEGIRAYQTDDGPAVFRLTDHIVRLFNSARIVGMEIPYTVDELIAATKATVASTGLEACYIRPLAYKSSEVLGVRVHDLDDDLLIFVAPFGPYLDIEKGIRCQTSSWRRVEDVSIPARAARSSPPAPARFEMTTAMRASRRPSATASMIACRLLPRPEIRMPRAFTWATSTCQQG